MCILEVENGSWKTNLYLTNCRTPVLGLGLGVDFTFAWDNNHNDNNNNDNKNPHPNFLKGTVLVGRGRDKG